MRIFTPTGCLARLNTTISIYFLLSLLFEIFFQTSLTVPKTVAHCRKYRIPSHNTLSRTIPYLRTLSRTIPYLKTLSRTIPVVEVGADQVGRGGWKTLCSREPRRVFLPCIKIGYVSAMY